MFTDQQRIKRLEDDVAELHSGIRAVSALSVLAIQSVLDQMVDERLLAPTTRAEIFKRITGEAGLLSAVSELVSRSARAAIPAHIETLKHPTFPRTERERKPLLRSNVDQGGEV